MARAARAVVLALAAVALFAAAAWAALNFPALSGRVVDEAGILSPDTQAKLTGLLAEHEQQTGNQVVVATVKSLQGDDIVSYGVGLGRAWGLGKEGKNNGVLITISPSTHDVRIDVGYGLEGTLTDAQSALIIQNVMLPSFRKGDYDSGVLNGTLVTLQALGGHPSANPPEDFQSLQRDASGNGGFHIPIVVIVIILWLVFGQFLWPLFFLGGMGGRGNWGGGGWGGGGGFGGGGFSGGGGSFGGGGASGHW